MLGKLIKIAALLIAAHYLVKLVLGLFRQRGRVYFLTPARQFSMLFWSLLSFWIAVSMLGSLVRDYSVTPTERIIAIGLFVLLALFALPTFLVHLQYWRYEKEAALELDPDAGAAILLQPGQKYLLTAGQIWEIQETRCRSNSFFWSRYAYWTLHLADGRQVKITSLLLDLAQLKALWPQVPLRTQTKFICFL